MMTCKELCEFIADYIEGELPEAQRLSFKSHIDLCTSCRDYMENYLHTIRAERAAMDCNRREFPPMPDEMVKAILEARKASD